MADKELVTVTVSIDVELVVEAESMEDAVKIAEREWMNELENANVTMRPRPFTEYDLEDNEYGWDEDCTPLGAYRTIGEILKRRG